VIVRAAIGLALALAAGPPAVAREISPEALASLPPADIVILGEVHDNVRHHEHQAMAVAALAPTALVFEMLSPEQAARATPAARAEAASLDAALGWTGSGWPDFALYWPLFAAAPDAAIAGAAVPRAAIRQAMAEGAAAAFGAGAERFGLLAPPDPADQAAREAEQQASHCNALPQDRLPGLVAAQRLRDAALARAALDALAAHGAPVVVIAGTGHARRDTGIPAALAVAAPDVRVLSIGQVEADPGPLAPFDLWIVTPPQPRPDPCAAFR
jgi:uncharacterized iron-regulated protein